MRDHAAPPAPTTNRTAPKDKWIWVLEDEENCQFVYDEVLSPHYLLRQFKTLGGFEEALHEKSPTKPHLIIADLRLPDGFFLDTLAKFHKTLPAPFVVVSSVQDSGVLRDCFNHGALDFMTKPFSGNELLIKVERLIGTHAATRKFTIDNRNSRVVIGSASTPKLTHREMQILQLLEHSTDKQMTRAKMVHAIWGNAVITPKNLDVHLVHLRRKLKTVGFEILMVAPGTYRLAATTEAS